MLEYKHGQQACFDVILCSWFSWNGARWTTDHQGSPSAGKGSFACFATGDPTDDGQIVLSGFQQKHMSPKELPFHVWSSTVSLKCFALSPASACLLGNLADANAASQYNTILYDIIVYYSKIIVYIFMDIWQSRHILDILRRLRLWCACQLRCFAVSLPCRITVPKSLFHLVRQAAVIYNPGSFAEKPMTSPCQEES